MIDDPAILDEIGAAKRLMDCRIKSGNDGV
jgi:hypothetical protein